MQGGGDDARIQQLLGFLRDGTRDQKIAARTGLANIFEQRGMFSEALELLEGNARAGIQDRALFTRLAGLYRQAGRYDDADAAMAEAASLLGTSSPLPPPSAPLTVQPTPVTYQPALPPRRQRGVVKTLGLGCLGCGGLVILGLILIAAFGGGAARQAASGSGSTAASTPDPSAQPTPLPGVGATSERSAWAITLEKADTAASLRNILGEKRAQGLFVVLTMTATNKSKQTTVLNTWDFKLSTADGTKYDVASEGTTALEGEPRPILLADQIQPGLSRQFREVFDVNPSVKGYILEAAGGNRFQITLP